MIVHEIMMLSMVENRGISAEYPEEDVVKIMASKSEINAKEILLKRMKRISYGNTQKAVIKQK